MLTRKAFGVVPGGSVQLIVGVVPPAEIVTLAGNGTGVSGITAADGRVAVVVVPAWEKLTCQVPLSSAVLNACYGHRN